MGAQDSSWPESTDRGPESTKWGYWLDEHPTPELLHLSRAFWAKTGDGDSWLSLPQHLADSGDVCGLLWDRWLPGSVTRYLAETCGGDAAARALAVFLAGTHDVGKASPAFQSKGTQALKEQCWNAGYRFDPLVAHRSSKLPHGLAGHLALERWLVEIHGWQTAQAERLAVAVGGHHGVFPTSREIVDGETLTELLGDTSWQRARVTLLEEALHRAGGEDHLLTWRNAPIPPTAQALLTAIVILADWIASNVELLPYDDFGDDRVAKAWELLHLPEPWRPELVSDDADTLLMERFSLPVGAKARPLQSAVMDLPERVDEPGLTIIEAPMGTGKTEAALLLAERLAAQQGLGGVFFALPSMSTSNAIFSRVKAWVERLPHPSGAAAPLHLAHSKAGLNDEFGSIVRDGSVRGIDPSEEAASRVRLLAVVHEWLSGRKKGLLANFTVGTIDQVLLMALRNRHLVLRHLALTNKVVVIDEVHAADEYMAAFMDRALEWLGAYRVPVILLSATLPGTRRTTMLQAYRQGRYDSPVGDLNHIVQSRAYPLVTATTRDGAIPLTPPDHERSTAITLTTLEDDLNMLTATLQQRLEGGGCAVVVRNSVSRAQATYQQLREHFGDDVSLIHARFIATDRLRKEQELLDAFGSPRRAEARPFRHIVVATQVVEQSLDVDFDLMVTDLAPVDLVLQRAGRLHRHSRPERPAGVREPELIVTGLGWDADLPVFEPAAKAIYGADALLRGLVTLGLPRSRTLSLPADIPHLIQDAYGESYDVPEALEPVAREASEEAAELRSRRQARAAAFLLDPPGTSLSSWTVRGEELSEAKGRATVRDGRESLEAIVVRQIGGELYEWGTEPMSAAPLPRELPPDPMTARRVSAHTVALPPALTHPGAIDSTIAALEANFFPGWQASSWLREQLVLALDENCQTRIRDFLISYDDELGIVAVRDETGHA